MKNTSTAAILSDEDRAAAIAAHSVGTLRSVNEWRTADRRFTLTLVSRDADGVSKYTLEDHVTGWTTDHHNFNDAQGEIDSVIARELHRTPSSV